MADHDTESSRDLKRDTFGIGIGGLGYMLGTAGLITYLTYFYTDNMLIPAASVSIILLLSRFIDAFTDLWMGMLVDRCRSRHGKARPWLLWMALPAAISVAAVYSVPALNETGRTVYAFITYNLMAFFYLTAMALPFNTLVSLVTSDVGQRLKLSQVAGFTTTLGAVFVNFFAEKIMASLGGGNAGFFWYFSLTGLIGVLLMLLCYKLTEERAETKKTEPKLAVKTALGAIFRNKYWWNAVAISAVANLLPACWGAAKYYCIYWMNDAVDVGELMALMWGGITAGILIFIPVSKRFAKNESAAIGLAIQAFGSVLLWFAPASVAMLWISTVFRSVGVGGLSGNIRAMLADVVEYGEWKTGIRTEGMVFTGIGFGIKVGSGLGSALVAALLAWGGYAAGQAAQTAKAMTSIKIAFVAAPFVGSCLVIIMLLFFRVEKLMPRIKAELHERKINQQPL
jgi:GPH family glycoside/pentoside/hexuronide:cation symporter